MTESKGDFKRLEKGSKRQRMSSPPRRQGRLLTITDVNDDVLRRMIAYLPLGQETDMATVSQLFKAVSLKSKPPSDIDVKLLLWKQSHVDRADDLFKWLGRNQSRVKSVALSRLTSDLLLPSKGEELSRVLQSVTELQVFLPSGQALIAAWKGTLTSLDTGADNDTFESHTDALLRTELPRLRELVIDEYRLDQVTIDRSTMGLYDGCLRNLTRLEMSVQLSDSGVVPLVPRIPRLEALTLSVQFPDEEPILGRVIEGLAHLGGSLHTLVFTDLTDSEEVERKEAGAIAQALAALPRLRFVQFCSAGLHDDDFHPINFADEHLVRILTDHKELTHFNYSKADNITTIIRVSAGLAPQLVLLGDSSLEENGLLASDLAKFLVEHPRYSCAQWREDEIILEYGALDDAKYLAVILDRLEDVPRPPALNLYFNDPGGDTTAEFVESVVNTLRRGLPRLPGMAITLRGDDDNDLVASLPLGSDRTWRLGLLQDDAKWNLLLPKFAAADRCTIEVLGDDYSMREVSVSDLAVPGHFRCARLVDMAACEFTDWTVDSVFDAAYYVSLMPDTFTFVFAVNKTVADGVVASKGRARFNMITVAYNAHNGVVTIEK